MTDSATYVYALCDPDTGEVRYIGKTTDLKDRLSAHLRASNLTDHTYKNIWIRSLLAQGKRPAMTVLERVASRTWQEAECDWIARYQAQGARLTNTTPGGDITMTDEVRAKLRAAARLRPKTPITPEALARISAANKGKHRSPEVRQRISQALAGKARGPHSEATRQKIGIANAGRTVSPETRAKLRDAKLNLTECKRGHSFTPENTMIRRNGARACRACHNAGGRRRRRAYARQLYMGDLPSRLDTPNGGEYPE